MPTVVFLSNADSGLGERVLAHVSGEAHLIPSTASPLVVDGGEVTWGGVRFLPGTTLFVESPLYPWPQPAPPTARDVGVPAEEERERSLRARDARALVVSAVRILARDCRVLNDPVIAADLSASPALALERLACAGLAVRPWLLTSGDGEPAVDLAGNPVDVSLVMGGDVVAHERRDTFTAPGTTTRPTGAQAAFAIAATRALALDVAVVHQTHEAVARVEAAPDLDAWDRRSDGRLSRALAFLLTATPSPEPAS